MQAHGRLYPTVRGIAQATVLSSTWWWKTSAYWPGNGQLAELHHQDVKLEIYHQERQAAAE